MRYLHTLLLFSLITVSCNSVKHIYDDPNVNERQYDKLVKMYLKNPHDTSVANRLVFAYESILQDHLNRIASLKEKTDIRSLESLVYAYDNLQNFYYSAAPAAKLLKPATVEAQRQAAVDNASAAMYDYASDLLNNAGWKEGREALGIFEKINRWIPNYRDSRQLMEASMEAGTIEAVIQPVRTEGFYQVGNYSSFSSSFSRQLTLDLRSNGYGNGLYRVFEASEANYQDIRADWVIEPVITRFVIDPVSYNRSSRTVTKTIEAGVDTAKRPVYKTITAVLNITEASVCAVTEMEARISDLQYRQPVNRRNFNESISLREVTATYTGDRNALSNEDWALVNNRNRLQVNERWMQEKLLEKVYPDMLSWLRNQLKY